MNVKRQIANEIGCPYKEAILKSNLTIVYGKYMGLDNLYWFNDNDVGQIYQSNNTKQLFIKSLKAHLKKYNYV